MPFAPELRYFYLFLKAHLEKVLPVVVERADDRVLTVPVLEKISDAIRRSDVVCADCTGRNPNVFYELGLAHAHKKKVILITRQPVEEMPSDVRHFEFIVFTSHDEFLKKLETTLSYLIKGIYDELYDEGKNIFERFQRETSAVGKVVSKGEFVRRARTAEQMNPLPAITDRRRLADFALRTVVEKPDQLDGQQVMGWLNERGEDV